MQANADKMKVIVEEPPAPKKLTMMEKIALMQVNVDKKKANEAKLREKEDEI